MNYLTYIALVSVFLASNFGFSTRGNADVSTDTLQQIVQIKTDVQAGLVCNLSVSLTSQKQLTGIQYSCSGTASGVSQTSYTVAQIQAGFVLYHDNSHNVDVATLSAPGFNATSGGAINIHYLYDYLAGTYNDYGMVLRVQNGSWVAFDPNNQAFNQMFLVGNNFMGNVIGIAAIQTSWNSSSFLIPGY